jgi:hypothetical protein
MATSNSPFYGFQVYFLIAQLHVIVHPKVLPARNMYNGSNLKAWPEFGRGNGEDGVLQTIVSSQFFGADKHLFG